MRTVILVIIATTLSITALAQSAKDTFYLSSFPTYDEFGNYYQVTKMYDHIPTSKDTSDFAVESNAQLAKLIDSVGAQYRYVVPAKKAIYKHDKTAKSTKRGPKR